MKHKLTKSYVEGLQPAERDYLVRDSVLPGFFVKITPTGKRVYGLYYRTANGTERRPSLGEHSPGFTTDTARKKAEEWIGLIRKDQDPSNEQQRKRKAISFKELAGQYLEEYSRHHKTPETVLNDESNLNNHLIPLLGHLKVPDMEATDIDRAIRAIADGKTAKTEKLDNGSLRRVQGGKGAAARCLILMKHIMGAYAESRGIRPMGSNPCRYVKMPETKFSKTGRARFLTPKEFAKLGELLEKLKTGHVAHTVTRRALYEEIWTISTKQAAENYGLSDRGLAKICGRYDIPIPDRGVWQKFKAGNAKLKKPLPLSQYAPEQEITLRSHGVKVAGENSVIVNALELLLFTGCRKSEILTLKWEFVDFDAQCLRLPESKTGAKIVPLGAPALQVMETIKREPRNPYVLPGKKPGQHIAGIDLAWQRIRSQIGLEDVTIHDLRRSFGSVGAAQGLSLLMIGKALSHKSQRATAVYARLQDDHTRQTVDLISNQVAAFMNAEKDKQAKVVPIR
ncbi:MAG: DUF4102 domain-containing protein [Alphaproteobacteria bacterium]|nr:DUF4102 domain-containing protein [Alphaproteobacteria bacterium]